MLALRWKAAAKKSASLPWKRHHRYPAERVEEWLPWVHIAIGNLKAYLLGTFLGVTGKYLQEYLDEFVYRFNRRFWEPELPLLSNDKIVSPRFARNPLIVCSRLSGQVRQVSS